MKNDNSEKCFEIENKKAVFNEQGYEIIEQVKNTAADVDKFINEYESKGEEAVKLLLKIQTNQFPLKKGGTSIAFQPDILFYHLMTKMSERAAYVWEAFSAAVSSRPEDEKYVITPKDIKPFTKHKSDVITYHAFNDGAEELANMKLKFDIPDPKSKKNYVQIPFEKGIHHIQGKDGENSRLEIYPNSFCKALLISSGVLHGAHWDRLIVKEFNGRYTKLVYIFCARNKDYAEYKGAPKGFRKMSVEQTKYEVGFKPDLETKYLRRYLDDAAEEINKTPESEFCLVVERFPKKGHIKGFEFHIQENRKLKGNMSYASIEKKAEYLKDNVDFDKERDFNNIDEREKGWNNIYESQKELMDQFMKENGYTEESIKKVPVNKRIEYFFEWRKNNLKNKESSS